MQKKENIQRLCVTAVLVALSTALSLVKVWQMPLGGSVTLLSMLPVAMISVLYGPTWGFAGAFVYSLTQFGFGIMSGLFGWGLTPVALVGAILLDYILPFTFLGVSGIFRQKGYIGVCLGTALAVALRFICHFLSGAIIFDIWCEWDSAWIYSLCYNGAYMLPELILTTIGATALFSSKQIKKLAGI